MGTVPRGTLVPASISLRMASRSPAMERSITVSAPAFTAAFSFFISISGLLQSGEVPMLALTLMPAGCPTRRGSTFLWQGLPRSTMVPSEMALRMTLRSSPSLAQRLSRWASRSFLRALFLLRISDILFSKKGRRKAVPSHGSQSPAGGLPAVSLHLPDCGIANGFSVGIFSCSGKRDRISRHLRTENCIEQICFHLLANIPIYG